MSFKLKEVTFQVRCTEPGCPFHSEFTVRENLMAATEAEVDAEAWKIARNMAYLKHDTVHGRNHPLAHPELHKISGRYERIAPLTETHAAPLPARPAAAAAPSTAGAAAVRTYRKGEKIIRKGESAVTVCEVLRGSAVNERRPELFYQPGTTFGAAALFQHKSRMADIVAGEDDTVIGFYNMRELSKSNPTKARELYNAAMEDIFDVLTYLEGYSVTLEKRLARLQAEKPAGKAARPAPKKKAAVKKAAPARKSAKKPAAKKKARARRR
jgi:CRP-like cAMP-binding protein